MSTAPVQLNIEVTVHASTTTFLDKTRERVARMRARMTDDPELPGDDTDDEPPLIDNDPVPE